MTPSVLTSAALRRAVQLKERTCRAAPSVRIRTIELAMLDFCRGVEEQSGMSRRRDVEMMRSRVRVTSAFAGSRIENGDRLQLVVELQLLAPASPRHFTRLGLVLPPDASRRVNVDRRWKYVHDQIY